MHEIVTLTSGNYSGFINAHFFNIQVRLSSLSLSLSRCLLFSEESISSLSLAV